MRVTVRGKEKLGKVRNEKWEDKGKRKRKKNDTKKKK